MKRKLEQFQIKINGGEGAMRAADGYRTDTPGLVVVRDLLYPKKWRLTHENGGEAMWSEQATAARLISLANDLATTGIDWTANQEDILTQMRGHPEISDLARKWKVISNVRR